MEIVENGNCVYCGNHIEDGHLFLCENCIKLELNKELEKNGIEIMIMKPIGRCSGEKD